MHVSKYHKIDKIMRDSAFTLIKTINRNAVLVAQVLSYSYHGPKLPPSEVW